MQVKKINFNKNYFKIIEPKKNKIKLKILFFILKNIKIDLIFFLFSYLFGAKYFFIFYMENTNLKLTPKIDHFLTKLGLKQPKYFFIFTYFA